MSGWIDLQSGPVRRALPALLRDKTTKKNIVFATDSYERLGAVFCADREITLDLLPQMDLKPRILKSQAEQEKRTRKKAEVFTPAWLCCKMNDHCDEEWFGRPRVFGRLEGERWEPASGVILFPDGLSWKAYVDSRRIEITCGEAPYIVSRYDAATGRSIPLGQRIGILDRKLRVVNENAEGISQWCLWALRAFQSVYGYEWQGDSLLIARLNLLMTFVETCRERWGPAADRAIAETLSRVANVIAWNFWQMDGLTGTVPHGAPPDDPRTTKQMSLFDLGHGPEVLGDSAPPADPGARAPCRIFDWRSRRPLTYNSLKRPGGQG